MDITKFKLFTTCTIIPCATRPKTSGRVGITVTFLIMATFPALLVGFLESTLIFVGGIITIVTASKNYLNNNLSRDISFLSIMLVFVVLGIATTNNFTAPVIFWIMLAQADILNKEAVR